MNDTDMRYVYLSIILRGLLCRARIGMCKHIYQHCSLHIHIYAYIKLLDNKYWGSAVETGWVV